ncbi:MAG: PA2169 family four-helix-bundle protein [Rhizobiaceae bacterium]|nr:MAG: PA2169 family four-helix-bundle protein [Rhizobiaceae bacterium]
MEKTHDVSVLNDLIATSLDSQMGFEGEADDAKDSRIATIFADFARDRGNLIKNLQTEAFNLGGKAEESPSTPGADHRGFMDLRHALTGKDDDAIVQEVERGEDHIKVQFEQALPDGELQSLTLIAARKAVVSFQSGHDTASAVKQSL